MEPHAETRRRPLDIGVQPGGEDATSHLRPKDSKKNPDPGIPSIGEKQGRRDFK